MIYQGDLMERLSNMFTQDSLAPFVYEDVFIRKSTHNLPEKRLMLAVLEEALIEYKQQSPSSEKFMEAKEYIFSDKSGLFSFLSVCEHLGLSVTYIRSNIKNRYTGAKITHRNRSQSEKAPRKAPIGART